MLRALWSSEQPKDWQPVVILENAPRAERWPVPVAGDFNGEVLGTFGFHGTPCVVIVGSDGRIIHRFGGEWPTPIESFDNQVAGLLGPGQS